MATIDIELADDQIRWLLTVYYREAHENGERMVYVTDFNPVMYRIDVHGVLGPWERVPGDKAEPWKKRLDWADEEIEKRTVSEINRSTPADAA